MNKFLESLVLFLTGIAGTLLRGYVIAKLWLWFVVPIFHVPAISIAQAIGVSVLVTLLTVQYDKDTENNDLCKVQVFFLSVTLAAWGIGAIAHQFV